MLTAARLREVLRYDPATGVFTWVDPGQNTALRGRPAGANFQRYVRIKIDGHSYLAQRLAVLYMCGRWPKHQVDHANCIRNDNRWCNLREAEHCQNMRNATLRRDNQSGVKGVSWCERASKWVVQIRRGGKPKHLGYFEDITTAAAVYAGVALVEYGEFARPVTRADRQLARNQRRKLRE